MLHFKIDDLGYPEHGESTMECIMESWKKKPKSEEVVHLYPIFVRFLCLS